jgi:hypothetical protein
MVQARAQQRGHLAVADIDEAQERVARGAQGSVRHALALSGLSV